MHQALRSFVVGLVLALFAIGVLAAGAQCTVYRLGSSHIDTWYPTKQQACVAGGAEVTADDPNFTWTCFNSDDSQTGRIVYKRCSKGDSSSCNYAESSLAAKQGDCDNTCESGKVLTVNFTVGWSRSGSKGITPDSDIVGPVAMPGMSYKNSCISSCKYSIGIDAGTNMYVANSPSATGLYRMSQDALVVNTGTECVPSTTDVADVAAQAVPEPKPCPGSVGQVNGKTVCVGTASTPLPAASGDLTQAGRALAITGDNGNPVAGPKPSTGEGSGSGGVGRTPIDGVGTATGGPIAAAAGGTGSAGAGTVTKPSDGTEQQNCGAPGQPSCKIDESGTPTVDPQKYANSLDGVKAEHDAALSTISGTGDKGMFESMRNLLTSAPPVVGCSAFDLPRDMGSINPCPVVDGVRYVMAFLWAIAGFWLCVRMVKQVV